MGRYVVILDPVARTPVATKATEATEVIIGHFGRYGRTFTALEARCPEYVDHDRWQQCITDGRTFLTTWGSQAEGLGWTSADLFGLHKPPEKPHPSYRRLGRYDCIGLIWLLEKRGVVALTEATATIKNPSTGTVTTYRRHLKPAARWGIRWKT